MIDNELIDAYEKASREGNIIATAHYQELMSYRNTYKSWKYSQVIVPPLFTDYEINYKEENTKEYKMSFMDMFKSPAERAKINKSTEQILELEVMKKRLEMERDSIQQELDNQKKRESMKIEVEVHKSVLKMQEEKAVFDREKKVWETEKKEIVDRFKRENEEQVNRLKQQSDLSLQEAVTLTKLDSQQKVIQLTVDNDRATSALLTKHATELAQVKTDLAEEYYNKLTKAFTDIQMNGDKNTQFVQDLAMKIFDRVPANKTTFGVDVNVPQLESVRD